MNDASAGPRRAALTARLLVLALGGLFLLGLLGFLSAVLAANDEGATPKRTQRPTAQPTKQPAAAARRILLAVAEPAGARGPSASSSALASALPAHPDVAAAHASLGPLGPGASLGFTTSADSSAPVQDGTEASPTAQLVPVIPVARFWSTQEGLGRRDLVRALETGRLPGFRRIVVEDGLEEALGAVLALDLHPDVVRGDVAQVSRIVRRGGLGLLRATDLVPSLRPLQLDGRSLLGNERIRDIADWPLLVTERPAEGEGWDQGRTWVLVAGGDAFTDRGVHDTVVRQGRGVDYPFDGGTARVTGHVCCDPVFGDNLVPRYVLTGNRGAVRRLFKDAELAIANHEMPTTEAWAFHRSGLRFSGRPDLTRIFTRAGIDWLSLANNHIKDYGTEGILDTRRILARLGIAFGGAGIDLAQARRISTLRVGGTRLAIIGCVGVAPSAWAGPDRSGGTPCLDRYLVPDIKSAERRADVVIVYPHWGVEYSRQPLPSMRKHAARWVKAGADLVLGGHSHVAGAIEDIDGVPVLYSLGNLIFDQQWSTDTMESVLLEATFHGGRLVGLHLRPYIIHDTSQPNFLDPASGEGRRLIMQVRAASADWLDW